MQYNKDIKPDYIPQSSYDEQGSQDTTGNYDCFEPVTDTVHVQSKKRVHFQEFSVLCFLVHHLYTLGNDPPFHNLCALTWMQAFPSKCTT